MEHKDGQINRKFRPSENMPNSEQPSPPAKFSIRDGLPNEKGNVNIDLENTNDVRRSKKLLHPAWAHRPSHVRFRRNKQMIGSIEKSARTP